MNKESERIIERLKYKYKEDHEALEVIAQAEADIEYIEAKEAAGGYTGQPSTGKAHELEAFLKDWY